jgi:hypothetical protein
LGVNDVVVRPEIYLYAVAIVMIAVGIALSYMIHVPVVGLVFLIIGVLLFLLPSMRTPNRKL